MSTPLKVLLVREGEEGLETLATELGKAGYEPQFRRVEVERDFFAHLQEDPDIIIAELELPQFSALSALQLLRERHLDIPLVVIADPVGEERAVDCLRQGAVDFLLRQRLGRLGQSVKMALHERRVRREQRQAEIQQQEGVERYRQLVEMTHDGLGLVEEGKITFINRSGARLLGAASRKQLTGKAFEELVAGDSAHLLKQLSEAAGEEGQGRVLEGNLVGIGGETVKVEISAVPFSEGDRSGLIIGLRDIRRREEAVAPLRLHSHLFSQLGEALLAVDSEDRITYWNAAAERLYGVPGEEALGEERSRLLREEWPSQALKEEADRALSSVGLWQGEVYHIRRDEGRMLVHSSAYRLAQTAAGEGGTLYLLRDITQQKQSEQASREEEARRLENLSKERNFFRSVVGHAAAFLMVLDPEGKILLFNHACEQSSGVPAEEIQGKTPWDMLGDPAKVEQSRQDFQHWKEHLGEEWQTEWITREGVRRQMVWSGSPLQDDQGALACVVATGRDVTQSRLSEQEAQAQTESMKAILEDETSLIMQVDAQGSIRYLSPALGRKLGDSSTNLLGRTLGDLVEEAEQAKVEQLLRDALEDPSRTVRLDLSFGGLSGSSCTLAILAHGDLEGALQGILLNCRDITDRKGDEDRLRARLRTLESIQTIDSASRSRLDLEATLEVVLEQVRAQVGADAAAILLYDSSSQTLCRAAARGFDGALSEQAPLKLGEGLPGQAALERRMIHVSDLQGSRTSEAQDLRASNGPVRGVCCLPLLAQGELTGVLEILHRSPLLLGPQAPAYLKAVALRTAAAIRNDRLLAGLRRASREARLAHDCTLEALGSILELRERMAAGHSRRVADLVARLALELGLSQSQAALARQGALLHDIGKFRVSEQILLKAGPLTEEEWAIVRHHPLDARELLESFPALGPLAEIPYCHQERWDGSGYPRGLSGEEIPLAARISAVAEVWDVLHCQRPYRQAQPEAKALEEIRAHSGTQFDPRVVETFLELHKRRELQAASRP